MTELFGGSRHPPERDAAIDCRGRASTLTAFGAQQTQVSATHQGAALTDEAYRGGSERMSTPGRIIWYSVAKQSLGDLAVADASQCCVERSECQSKSAAALRGEPSWVQRLATRETAPRSACSLHAGFEQFVEGEDDRNG